MASTRISAEPGDPRTIITREFAAPRQAVFRAHIDPALLRRWLGPRGMTMTVPDYDVRDGGVWRFIHRDENGAEYDFHGVFHGTPTPDRTIRTFEYEGMPGHVSLETLTLHEHGAGTLLREVSVFQTVEDRDGMLESGMEQGVRQAYEQLDGVLASMVSLT